MKKILKANSESDIIVRKKKRENKLFCLFPYCTQAENNGRSICFNWFHELFLEINLSWNLLQPYQCHLRYKNLALLIEKDSAFYEHRKL